mgnify:CR=1 FL=1
MRCGSGVLAVGRSWHVCLMGVKIQERVRVAERSPSRREKVCRREFYEGSKSGEVSEWLKEARPVGRKCVYGNPIRDENIERCPSG